MYSVRYQLVQLVAWHPSKRAAQPFPPVLPNTKRLWPDSRSAALRTECITPFRRPLQLYKPAAPSTLQNNLLKAWFTPSKC